MTVHARLTTITIDCTDPKALAEFYRDVTGWEITHSDDDSAEVGTGPVQLAFQRVDGYRSPGWGDGHTHVHLDFAVTDVDAATERLLDLGATKPDLQPGEDRWTVLVDPEGHPFCIATA
ncbi:VOC family protein [Saccharomonospora cyanea]|uniref:Lactoylglutathione lyase family protein n=1 Tax=Saccharomonospora cyanea NA-134 TaxID=882082 RepID=H5XC75_9PSEU|nr:VOC family protein [Saccharomonospora cyanea]EHR59079.1 lactoylglutathione lyase family protein [Saccharomonospora cyanea NA-134]